ncbi:MAG: hypothetical protein LBE91_16415 [Tannerella sp.]|jgi:hypothetical protein|nr:hypothetical protein [Tannerella sp.]
MQTKFFILLSVFLWRACGSNVTTQTETSFTVPDWRQTHWQEVPENPMIGADFVNPDLAIGDPQVLTPNDFDGQWHMFYHGFGFSKIATFFHQISDDGLHWTEASRQDGDIEMQYMFCDGDRWIQYYTSQARISGDTSLLKYSNVIRARTTKDFINWCSGQYYFTRDPSRA